jgi:single-strand selective monofunctional uracil DNA glycosylase
MDPVRISRKLAKEVDALSFSEPVAYVYNPLVYARRGVEAYLKRFARPGARAMLIGMNPGPFGMAQTGVPFGEVELVRDWMGIEEKIDKPPKEHPKRPIQGFDCTRSEVSGRRLWGWAKERYGRPEPFFERFFVWNYCPLVFMEESGRNRTPDKLPSAEREALFRVCDAALVRMIDHIAPAHVIGVGKFAQKQTQAALGADATQVQTVLHPSPASPMANRGWAPQAEKQFVAMGLEL